MPMSGGPAPRGVRAQNVTSVLSGENPSVRMDGFELRRAAARQVHELSGADLRHPDVHPTVAVGLERDELAVARQRGRLLDPVEVRERLEPRPEEGVFAGGRAAAADLPRREGRRGDRGDDERPGSGAPERRSADLRSVRAHVGPVRFDRRVPLRRAAVGGWRPHRGGLGLGGAPARGPGVEIGPERVHGPDLVVHVTVDGHALALLPPLHRRHVAPHVSGDFLPRVQAIRGAALGGGRRSGRRRVLHVRSGVTAAAPRKAQRI
jgi:hypothetical protein